LRSVAGALTFAFAVASCADIIGVETLTGADASTADGASDGDDGASDASTPACALTWVASSGGVVPPGAVPSNPSDAVAVTIYVCRARTDAGLVPGKLLPAWGCYIADPSPFHGNDYEVLVPSHCVVTWTRAFNGIAPGGAIQCGSDSQGPLFACRTSDTSSDPGEIGHMGFSTDHTCSYTLGSSVLSASDFEVLSQP
jgi:hypothetical protein